MKKITLLAVAIGLAFTTQIQAQSKYSLSNSHVRFFSHGVLEDIEAINKDTKGVIDFDAKAFSFKIPIKSFKFDNSLQQEHFNENYMESDKFPDANFKGTIQGNYDITKDGVYNVTAVGDLIIHGVTKKRSIPAVITVKDGKASINAKFMVKVAEHGIEIPTLMFKKIAEEVEVTIKSALVVIPAK